MISSRDEIFMNRSNPFTKINPTQEDIMVQVNDINALPYREEALLNKELSQSLINTIYVFSRTNELVKPPIVVHLHLNVPQPQTKVVTVIGI